MFGARVPVLCPDHFPDGFRRMVERIVDDVAAALPVLHPELRVVVGDPTGKPLLTFTVWFDHVRRAAFGLPVRMLKANVEQLRRDLAERLQDAFVEEYGRPLPPCPGHEHPLVPEVREVAVWQCPNDPGHWSCRIGDYQVAG
ncbi:hypothetical protein [Kutzneria sp. CA-103260]|uniref:hypothetical protein n=1 Tax=Kutzneria sp. CA-103260 TaxID=2802641 RepID=UPI001BACF2AC|nr:hypothetical protein [Kutzneria sp. CA-103260]QUQ70292.1 hypothetical protein JJ691_80670 [Kutzneria sp. CA-103260]